MLFEWLLFLWFTDFEQIWARQKIKWLLLTLSLCKTPLGETGCLSIFLGYLSMSPALHLGFSELWRSPPALSSILTAFGCLLFVQASSFLIHSPFSQHSHLGRLWLPTPHHAFTVQCLCDLQNTIHASGHQALPTQLLPREAEDFPRCGNHSKHVPWLTYLPWLQPIYYDLGFVFIHVKLGMFLLVVKTLIKKSIEQQSH